MRIKANSIQTDIIRSDTRIRDMLIRYAGDIRMIPEIVDVVNDQMDRFPHEPGIRATLEKGHAVGLVCISFGRYANPDGTICAGVHADNGFMRDVDLFNHADVMLAIHEAIAQ